MKVIERTISTTLKINDGMSVIDTDITLPVNAKILQYGAVGHEVAVWAMTDNDAIDMELHKYRLFETWVSINDETIQNYDYIITIVCNDLMTWHIFKKKTTSKIQPR
jgi:hypothetical protein